MPLMPQRSASMATDASEDEPEEEEYVNPREKEEDAARRLKKKRLVRDAALEEEAGLEKLFDRPCVGGAVVVAAVVGPSLQAIASGVVRTGNGATRTAGWAASAGAGRSSSAP